ncbi:MAG: PD-(D/E)XK nuclease family protein [Salinivirgaceae bacterium]|nr:PD-(D/E)XK nuclease family protein [Salinivirgaceae bacterium]
MKEDLERLQFFLKELTVIRRKYEEMESHKDQFNVFEAMFKTGDERNLHSRFIWSLLQFQSNNEYHYLDKFLDTIESQFDYEDSETICVLREYKDIDILVIDYKVKKAVIIENKIYADDCNHKEEGQLEKYYREVIEEEKIPATNIEVYYLTLDGHEPTEDSVATSKKYPDLSDKVVYISYKYHIIKWLENCMQFIYDKPFQRETILQYIKLINTMVNNVNDEEQIEIKRLIGKSADNLKSAKLLIDNIRAIHKHTIADFWTDLTEELRKKYVIVSQPKDDDFNNIAYGSKIKQNKTVLSIEIRIGDAYNIGIDEGKDMMFNFGVEKKQKIGKEYIQAFEELCERNKDKNIYESDKDTYIWKYPSPPNDKGEINSWLYYNDVTFNLISDDYRKEIIGKIVSEIDVFVKDVEKIAKRIRQK